MDIHRSVVFNLKFMFVFKMFRGGKGRCRYNFSVTPGQQPRHRTLRCRWSPALCPRPFPPRPLLALVGLGLLLPLSGATPHSMGPSYITTGPLGKVLWCADLSSWRARSSKPRLQLERRPYVFYSRLSRAVICSVTLNTMSPFLEYIMLQKEEICLLFYDVEWVEIESAYW